MQNYAFFTCKPTACVHFVENCCTTQKTLAILLCLMYLIVSDGTAFPVMHIFS